MNERRTIRRSLTSTAPDRSDWRHVDGLTDAEIERAVRADPDAAPILEADWFARARTVLPPVKELISIRIDADLLKYFRALGPGYQTRINAVLRAFVEHESLAARTKRLAHRHAAARKSPTSKKVTASVTSRTAKARVR